MTWISLSQVTKECKSMNHIKTYNDFINAKASVDEAEGKEEKGKTEVEKINVPESGAMTDFEIDGKKFKGVISTFQAIGQKQKAMGQEAVGVLTLPGAKEVYELFPNEGGEDSKKEEEGKEEKKENK